MQLLPAFAVVALGAGIHGVLGFGSGLIWMAFFPMFTPVSSISKPPLVSALALHVAN